MYAWRKSLVTVALTVLGIAFGLGSVFGEWSRVVQRDGTTAPAWTLTSLGVIGIPYASGLIALLTMVAIALFVHHRRSRIGLRVAGLVVSGLSIVLLLVVASMFSRDIGFGELYYRVNSSYDQDQILGWGMYCAFGAMIVLGAALTAATTATRRAALVAGTPDAGPAGPQDFGP